MIVSLLVFDEGIEAQAARSHCKSEQETVGAMNHRRRSFDFAASSRANKETHSMQQSNGHCTCALQTLSSNTLVLTLTAITTPSKADSNRNPKQAEGHPCRSLHCLSCRIRIHRSRNADAPFNNYHVFSLVRYAVGAVASAQARNILVAISTESTTHHRLTRSFCMYTRCLMNNPSVEPWTADHTSIQLRNRSLHRSIV